MAKEAAVKTKKPKVDNSDISIDEMIDNLKAQYTQFINQSKEAENMALKALGAIEVLTGLSENTKNGEA